MKTKPQLVDTKTCQPAPQSGTQAKVINPENQSRGKAEKLLQMINHEPLKMTETTLLKNYSQFFIALS